MVGECRAFVLAVRRKLTEEREGGKEKGKKRVSALEWHPMNRLDPLVAPSYPRLTFFFRDESRTKRRAGDALDVSLSLSLSKIERTLHAARARVNSLGTRTRVGMCGSQKRKRSRITLVRSRYIGAYSLVNEPWAIEWRGPRCYLSSTNPGTPATFAYVYK